VHIAEEARDNGSTEIFDSIMSKPVKYSVMNDYDRTVEEENPPVASLNGDTAIRSTLDIKQKYEIPGTVFYFGRADGFRAKYFNITEDTSIDEEELEYVQSGSATPYLYRPLPSELPHINKDLLILLAAYYGDIDRYCRLRRPVLIPKELNCIIRGIYHNTMFAKWWSLQPFPSKRSRYTNPHIMCAINARFIMNNDLSRITAETINNPPSEQHIPYTIFYPNPPSEITCKALAKRVPTMKPQIARACIIGNYEDLFNELDVFPDAHLMREAKASPNPHYARDLERRVIESGKEIENPILDVHDWKRYTRVQHFEPTSTTLRRTVSDDDLVDSFEFVYDGVGVDTSHIELHVCSSIDLIQEDIVELGFIYGIES
jgi:hypothetical protein